MAHSTAVEIGGRTLTLETGRVARQADGAVMVRYGGTVVLATVVATRTPLEGVDFFPLTVDYRERAYAGGRIPGGFFKREGRPVEKEILTSRLIDRPLRPLFPKAFKHEVQVLDLVISGDQENDPDVLAVVGSSAALAISGVPFNGPGGAVRVGLGGGEEGGGGRGRQAGVAVRPPRGGGCRPRGAGPRARGGEDRPGAGHPRKASAGAGHEPRGRGGLLIPWFR